MPEAVSTNPTRGIALKIASVAVFMAMVTCIKLVSIHVPTGEAVFFRSFFAIPVILVWLMVVLLSGYVGLATIMAGFSAPVYLLLTGEIANQPLMTLAVSMALFLVYTHRENIRRLKAGAEARVGQLAIFRRDS